MGIFGGTKSNSSKRFEEYLAPGEQVQAVYRLIIDEICFTNLRVIFFDKNALSTKKEKICIPYKSIRYFTIENEGLLERDIEVKLATSAHCFTLRFSKSCDFVELEKLLALYICG